MFSDVRPLMRMPYRRAVGPAASVRTSQLLSNLSSLQALVRVPVFLQTCGSGSNPISRPQLLRGADIIKP